jgi:hypothetical protein
MSGPQESFKINLNQNLWGLIVAFGSLGAAEYFHLCILFWFAVVLAGVTTLSVVATTAAYTINYCVEKFK